METVRVFDAPNLWRIGESGRVRLKRVTRARRRLFDAKARLLSLPLQTTRFYKTIR